MPHSSSSEAGESATRLNWMLCVSSMMRLTTATVSCASVARGTSQLPRSPSNSSTSEEHRKMLDRAGSAGAQVWTGERQKVKRRTSSKPSLISPWLTGLLRRPSSSIRHPLCSTNETKCRSVSASSAGACVLAPVQVR